MVVRKIGSLCSAVESKVNNLHARISGTLNKLYYRRSKITKILSYHIHLSQHFLHPCKESIARTLFPFAYYSIFSAVRNGIIGIKTSEMVYSYSIIKLKSPGHTLHPPLVAGLLMIIPVIERVAPKLTCSRKGIRRTACNRYRGKIFIKLEKFRICPGIRRVKGHIDRHISDYLYSLFIGIFFKLLPLYIKHPLNKNVKFYLISQFLFVLFKCLRLTKSESFLPLTPGYSVLRILYSHKK